LEVQQELVETGLVPAPELEWEQECDQAVDVWVQAKLIQSTLVSAWRRTCRWQTGR